MSGTLSQDVPRIHLPSVTMMNPAIRHVGDIWNGRVRLSRLLWREMLVFGTAINLCAMTLTLTLAGLNAPTPWVLLAWLACWPLNAFLCISVWHTAGVQRRPLALSLVAPPLATVWMLVVSVL